jgi:hypothetical protein
VLKYTFEGVDNITPLWPDTITVVPESMLILKYFVEKDVFGDVPFNLGLMIQNEGYGTARNIKITSGRPSKVISCSMG